MEKEIYTKYYGVKKLENGRYAVITDVNTATKQGHVHIGLNYAKVKFALKKADAFAKSCHKNFIRKIGDKQTSIEFVLNNVGLVNF